MNEQPSSDSLDSLVQRVLCPLDFSDTSQRAVGFAVAVGRKFGAVITLAHVYEESTFAPAGEDPPLATATSRHRREEAKTQLELCAAGAGGAPVVGTRFVVVQDGTVVQAILDCAGELDASIIVMGTHGLSGFKRLLYGSTTEGILRKSNVPVLAVPPQAR
jgi:nucleotide-binding universal stress UspA family protein